MTKNQVVKVVRILTQYDGYCHAVVQIDEQGIYKELIQISVSETDLEVKVGTVLRCTKVKPLLFEKINPENVLSFEQFMEITQNFNIVSYCNLIEIFEKLKGKVGLFCGDYPNCTMKLLIQILAYYENADDFSVLLPTIRKFLNSKTVSDSLKEEARYSLEEVDDFESISTHLFPNKDLKDYTEDEFQQLNFHLCQLESGKNISALLFQLAKYFDFSWNQEKDNLKGHEKKIGEMN